MYIEVLHDLTGNITACYCADTLPEQKGAPLFSMQGGVPVNFEQARVNIDTLTAMEIDAASGQKAIIDPATGLPVLVTVDRAEYIMKTFKVDVSSSVSVPHGVTLPANMKIKMLVRR